jgi:hypothetical protein
MIRGVEWLKHAFAVDPPGPAVPSETQRALVDKLCEEIMRRRLIVPALFMLEMSRPLNYVSAQVLHFFQPLVAVITDTSGYLELTHFLEKRGAIDYVCQRLEAMEARVAAKEDATALGRGPEGARPQTAERHGDH